MSGIPPSLNYNLYLSVDDWATLGHAALLSVVEHALEEDHRDPKHVRFQFAPEDFGHLGAVMALLDALKVTYFTSVRMEQGVTL